MRRSTLGVVIAALVAAVTMPLLAVATAASAEAAAFRYWSYWTVTDGAWKFAQAGPTDLRPADGTVVGWRFAVTTDSSSAAAPRLTASTAFAAACGGPAEIADKTVDGKKLVALVMDFGAARDARPGDSLPSPPLRSQCVTVPENASGWQVLLATRVAIRSDRGGMVCGLAGYPSVGCGEQVAAPAPKKPATRATPDAVKGSKPKTPTSTAGNSSRGGSASPAVSTTTSRSTSPSTSTTSKSPRATVSPDRYVDDAAEPTPTLVDGLPAASSDGAGSNPWPAVLGVLVLGGVGAAAFLRARRSRRTGAAG